MIRFFMFFLNPDMFRTIQIFDDIGNLLRIFTNNQFGTMLGR